MNQPRLLLASAILAAGTAALHTGLGTIEIQRPLLDSALPTSVSWLLFACWHLVSVMLTLSAAGLFWSWQQVRAARGGEPAAARDPGRAFAAQPLVRFIALAWVLFGSVFIAVALSLGPVATLWLLPQWILLIPIGMLAWLGAPTPRAALAAREA